MTDALPAVLYLLTLLGAVLLYALGAVPWDLGVLALMVDAWLGGALLVLTVARREARRHG